MDFKTQVPGAGGAAAVDADALLVVVGGDSVPAALPKALVTACQQAVKSGDFALKNGRAAYLGAIPGVKASRVVFAHAADNTTAAWRTSSADREAPRASSDARNASNSSAADRCGRSAS